jgi:hypothetical protein
VRLQKWGTRAESGYEHVKMIRAITIYTSYQNIIESNLPNKQEVSHPPQSAQ